MNAKFTKDCNGSVGRRTTDLFRRGRNFLVMLVGAFALMGHTSLQAQSIRVSGKVTDESNQPMVGVAVIVQGTTTGTSTDASGAYSITAPGSSSSLVFSFLGYETQIQAVGSRTTIDVSLKTDAESIDEVVVTALGIRKDKKKLAYAVQDVVAPDLDKMPVTNMAANLTGKVAGLRVTNSPNLFDKPNLTLRGESPKVAVDGIIVESSTFYEMSSDDIESINVLKGPAASVLYGQAGQYGVIQITSKKASEGVKITVNSSTGFDVGLIAQPEYQTKYGTGKDGQFILGDVASQFNGAWGPELDGRLIVQYNSPFDENGNRIAIPWIPRGRDNLKNMLQTGVTTSNNVSFETKSTVGDFRGSVTHVYQRGVFENTMLNNFIANIGGGVNLGKKLRADINLNYSKLTSPNYPSVGYGRTSPVYTMILWTGANVDVNDLRNYWVPGQEGIQQRNYDVGGGYINGAYDYNNPFFILHENLKGYNKDFINGMGSLKYQITSDLDFTARLGVNTYHEFADQKTAFSTVNQRNGNYSYSSVNDFQAVSDLILKYGKQFGDFGVDAMVGSNGRRWYRRTLSAATDGLNIPGIYRLANSKNKSTSNTSLSELQELAGYGFLDVNWKSYIFLNATYRLQSSSTIPKDSDKLYSYSSYQVATIVSEYLPMPRFVDYLKLRVSSATVGSAFSPYSYLGTYSVGTTPWNNQMILNTPDYLAASGLIPSFSTGYEAGAELRLFKNRLKADFTYFYFVDGPQTYNQEISEASGWTKKVVNGREYLRKGWELSVGVTPVKNRTGLTWDILLNASRYRRTLHKLPEGVEKDGYLKVGDRADAIYGSSIMRAPEGSEYAGQMIIQPNGRPLTDNIKSKLGYRNSDLTLGLINNITYKNISFNFSFDANIGGQILSQYQKYLFAGGASLELDDQARQDYNAGKLYTAQGVKVISGSLQRDGDGKVISDDRVFAPSAYSTSYFDYTQYYNGYYGADDANLINRTFVKLRETVVTYRFPAKWFGNTTVKSLSVSFTGRNLFLFTPWGVMDPDQFNENNDWDNLQTPSFRNLGFNINFTF